ncbi:MAG: hypothetical protein R3F62_23280 [Planctomycetota bacterium]
MFGVILIVSAWKVAFHDEDADPQSKLVLLPLGVAAGRRRAARAVDRASGSARMQLMTGGYRGSRFMVVEDGKRKFTTLFLVLLVIEGRTSCSRWTRCPRSSA